MYSVGNSVKQTHNLFMSYDALSVSCIALNMLLTWSYSVQFEDAGCCYFIFVLYNAKQYYVV